MSGIGLTDYIKPKNDAFTGMVQASQVLGGGGDGTLPDACVAESNVTQHEAAIDHDQLTNFAGDEHVAHSGVSVLAGTHMTGGGTIEATRTLNVDSASVMAAHDTDDLAEGSSNLYCGTNERTVGKMIYIEDPTASDVWPICYVPKAATMQRVVGVTDTGSVTFNIQKRSKTTPDVDAPAAVIWTAGGEGDQDATAGGLDKTVFDAASIGAGGKWLVFVASAVSSATKVWIGIEYTID